MFKAEEEEEEMGAGNLINIVALFKNIVVQRRTKCI